MNINHFLRLKGRLYVEKEKGRWEIRGESGGEFDGLEGKVEEGVEGGGGVLVPKGV